MQSEIWTLTLVLWAESKNLDCKTKFLSSCGIESLMISGVTEKSPRLGLEFNS